MSKNKFNRILEASKDHKYAKVKHLYANLSSGERREFLIDFLDKGNKIHARVKYTLLMKR